MMKDKAKKSIVRMYLIIEDKEVIDLTELLFKTEVSFFVTDQLCDHICKVNEAANAALVKIDADNIARLCATYRY